MRDSMIFYRSFFEALIELEPIDRAALYDAIFSYGLDFKEPELKGIQATIWKLIKPNIEANIKKYNDGNKGGRPTKNKTTLKPQENHNQTNTKPLDNHNKTTSKPNVDVNDDVDGNVNVKVNDIEGRKLKFADTLRPFIEVYGKDMILDFYRYWTEHNKSNTKFKYELEKTWNLQRRLETWAKNDYSRSSNKTETKIQRWKDPSEVFLCTDWIKRIPKPPNLNDDEACMDFIITWNIRELRKYQYEQTGTTNQIADYEE